VEESEGGREESAAWRLAPLEAAAREAGEGWGPGGGGGSTPGGGEKQKRGPGVWRRGLHDTDAVAPGRSDSGGQRTTHGRGRLPSGVGPGGQRRCAKGRGGSEAAATSGADRQDRQHSAAGAVLNRFKQNQKYSNGFKILQTLTDPKGAFPCSKNRK
jgi:hypothetical protein